MADCPHPPRWVAWTRTPPSRNWVRVATGMTEGEARAKVFDIPCMGRSRDLVVLPVGNDPEHQAEVLPVSDRPCVRLTLRPEPGSNPDSDYPRLRKILKRLLRSLGFRCVRLEWLEEAKTRRTHRRSRYDSPIPSTRPKPSL